MTYHFLRLYIIVTVQYSHTSSLYSYTVAMYNYYIYILIYWYIYIYIYVAIIYIYVAIIYIYIYKMVGVLPIRTVYIQYIYSIYTVSHTHTHTHTHTYMLTIHCCTRPKLNCQNVGFYMDIYHSCRQTWSLSSAYVAL